MKYYVSVVDGTKFGLLLGPFNTHKEAKRRVEAVREKAYALDERSWFYAFGTCGLKDHDDPGKLNHLFPDLFASSQI